MIPVRFSPLCLLKKAGLQIVAQLALLFCLALVASKPVFAGAPKISPKFSLIEVTTIEAAIGKIPACHKPKLENLRFVQSDKLLGPADDCDEGFYPGNGSIVLYSKCGFTVGTVVHEIFHHLGRFDGLNEKWKHEVLRKIPNCPVTEYAEDGLGKDNEDLAETGQILLAPEDSSLRLPGKCVDEKVETLRKILAESC